MKTILLTGVSKGLGLVLLKLLLKDGNIIYGISRSDNEELNKLKKLFPDNFIHLKYDLSLTESVKELSKYILKNKLKFDSFVNNAAVAYDDIITNANFDKLDLMFKTNVLNPIMITKSILRNFILNNVRGSIIHISSISVHTGYKGLSMYASTKGALEAFSKNTAREWGEFGIRSNCVVAGFMETDMSDGLTDEQKDRIYKRTSLKKETDKYSVAETIKFLISDGSSSITGQNLFVDSGTI
jgi:3-oxoacyl-[acyl-carrier protein] reductase